MKERPPSSVASSSKTPSARQESTTNQPATIISLSSPPLIPHSNETIPQPYANWNAAWPSGYDGYSPPTTTSAPYLSSSNPYAAHVLQSHTYSATKSPPSAYSKPTANLAAKSEPHKARFPSSTLPHKDPKTFQNWDQVVKKFLVKTKMTEALKGFESDMLVLNPEWEQKIMTEALKQMVDDLQAILTRIEGIKKQGDNSMNVKPEGDINITEGRLLDERKLDYTQVSNGVLPQTQATVNKSISQFLARTRARNNASNRAEFLYTLAEKRRQVNEKGVEEMNITSCARVDAKPIDRDKQIKYDIAKYGEGPLIKTIKPSVVSNPSAASEDVTAPTAPIPLEETASTQDSAFNKSQRKRKLVLDSDGEELEAKIPKPSRKRKGKGKEKEKEKDAIKQVKRELDEDAMSKATSEKHPGLDERIKNVETHLAIRYVPTPPRTLLARLKFLEDHLIKLEKEYPPWAALHFNQPNREWPPPPRATPLIVPPHLRSFASTSTVPPSTTNSSYPPTTASSAPASSVAVSNATTSAVVKPRKGNSSSLHKAVLERLEVQKARSEIGGKGGRD